VAVPEGTRVELIERIYSGWAAGDLDLATEALDPEIVWNAISSAPDAGTYRGIDGARDYMRDWLEDFVMEENEALEVIERGDHVFRYSRGGGTGRGSGVRTDITYAQIYSFTAAGKIAGIDEYATREEGISEFDRRTGRSG
jgi:ketosteroid isomerase-like protein